jgi:hypothetical protein
VGNDERADEGGPRTSGPAAVDPDAVDPRVARRLPEGLRAWAVLAPNAPAYRPGRLHRAFVRRQLLKSQGCFVAERVLVAVGADELEIRHVLPHRVVGRRIARVPLDAVVSEQVVPEGAEDLWAPAIRVSIRRRTPSGSRFLTPLVEVRGRLHDARALEVAHLLLTEHPCPAHLRGEIS